MGKKKRKKGGKEERRQEKKERKEERTERRRRETKREKENHVCLNTNSGLIESKCLVNLNPSNCGNKKKKKK